MVNHWKPPIAMSDYGSKSIVSKADIDFSMFSQRPVANPELHDSLWISRPDIAEKIMIRLNDPIMQYLTAISDGTATLSSELITTYVGDVGGDSSSPAGTMSTFGDGSVPCAASIKGDGGRSGGGVGGGGGGNGGAGDERPPPDQAPSGSASGQAAGEEDDLAGMPDLIDDGKVNHLEYLDPHILIRTHDGETVPIRVEEDILPPDFAYPDYTDMDFQEPFAQSSEVPTMADEHRGLAPVAKSSQNVPQKDSSGSKPKSKIVDSQTAPVVDPSVETLISPSVPSDLPTSPSNDESMRIALELIAEEELSKSKSTKKKEKKKAAKAKKALAGGVDEGGVGKDDEDANEEDPKEVAELACKAAEETEAAQKAAIEAARKAAAEAASQLACMSLSSSDLTAPAPPAAEELVEPPALTAGRKMKAGATPTAPKTAPTQAPSSVPNAPAPTSVLPMPMATPIMGGIPPAATRPVVQQTPPSVLPVLMPQAPLIRPPIFQHLAALNTAPVRPLIIPSVAPLVRPPVGTAMPLGVTQPLMGVTAGPVGVPLVPAAVMPQGLAQVLARQVASPSLAAGPSAPLAMNPQDQLKGILEKAKAAQMAKAAAARQQQQPKPVQQQEDDNFCVVCMEEQKSIVLSPCGHVALCAGCCASIRKKQNECPMCRATIEDITELS